MPGGDIPRRNAVLVEHVEAAAGDRAQVDRRPTHATDVADVGQHVLQYLCLRSPSVGAIAETGADQCFREVECGSDAAIGDVVAECAAATPRPKNLTERGIDDDADAGSPSTIAAIETE